MRMTYLGFCVLHLLEKTPVNDVQRLIKGSRK